jgi:hypothetical protein
MKGAVLCLVLWALPSSAFAASESSSVERLYSEWRFGEADRALATLDQGAPC